MQKTIIAALIGTVALVGCSSTGDPGETAETLVRRNDAASKSTAENGDTTIPVAGSYMGDASAETVNAKADRTTSASTAFTQKAFDFAGAIEATGRSYMELMQNDPVVSALRAELARADATAEERAAALDALREHAAELRATLSRAGGDMSALTSLTVVNTATHAGNSGHESKPLTPEEAAAASTAIPNVVNSAKGER